MQLVWLFVLTGAVVTQGSVHYAKSCPPPFGKNPFSADRFQGIWYTVARHVSLPVISRQLSCEKINYTVTRTENSTLLGIEAQIKQKSGETREIEMKAKQLWSWDRFDSSVSQIVRKSEASSWGEVGQHSIWSTDYDTYAILQVCLLAYDEGEDDIKRLQVTEVLSRLPTMDASKLKLLKSVASSFDVDETEFKDIDNSGC